MHLSKKHGSTDAIPSLTSVRYTPTLDDLHVDRPEMTTLVSLTGKEQTLKLTGFYGAATPVHEFEKLNQIGEGSTSLLTFN
jgi:hypothetical protein